MNKDHITALTQKWDKIYQHKPISEPSFMLLHYRYLLPNQGRALDIASGLGGNACLLAEQGLETRAWDISLVAMQTLQAFAVQQRLNIQTKQCYISANCLPAAKFDVVNVSRFLDRSLSHAIMDSLKPGGLLFYQTYTQDKRDAVGPNNPDYLLQKNELLMMFQSLHVVFYQENGRVGQLQQGERNEAFFIGQKLN